MTDLTAPLALDLMTLSICIYLLLRYGRISMMHPAPTYILFHIFECTQRLAELAFGAPASFLFSAQPLTVDEISKAALLFDMSLASVTFASLVVASRDLKAHGRLPAQKDCPPGDLVPKYFQWVAAVLFPIACFAVVQSLRASHDHSSGALDDVAWRSHDSWTTSFFGTMDNDWLAMLFIPLVYLYGTKKRLMVPFAFAGGLIIATGYDRWRITLPLIAIAFIYLSRKEIRWPRAGLSILLIIAGLIWLPSKEIGSEILNSNNGDIVTAVQAGVEKWQMSIANSDSEDSQFLDLTAAYVADCDRYIDHGGSFTYGTSSATVFYHFIPRPLWKDKPVSGGYLQKISTHSRNLWEYCATASLPGSAYSDFGYFGPVLEPFLFMLYMCGIYFNAYRQNYYSIARFTYIIYACTLLQVYRDGLPSFVVFNFINFWPLMLITLLHKFAAKKRIKALVRMQPLLEPSLAELKSC